jgi:ABC-type sugar transport system ATPase subunit
VRPEAARGVSIVFISHALEEAPLLAGRITVLRDGKRVITDDVANFDCARIVHGKTPGARLAVPPGILCRGFRAPRIN